MKAGLLTLLACFGTPHPDSASTTLLVVRGGGRIDLVQELQVLSVLEVLPALDLDGDGWLDEDEVGRGAVAVYAYVQDHYGVRTCPPGEPLGMPLPAFEPVALELMPPDPEAFLPVADRVRLRAVLRFPEWDRERAGVGWGRTPISVWTNLFLDTSPAHLDRLEVRWPDALPVRDLLGAGRPQVFLAPGPSLLQGALGLGLRAGYLGVAPWMLLLLGLGARHPRGTRVLAVAVALVAAALGLAGVPGPSPGITRTAGLALAVGTAYLGADTLLGRTRRGRVPEALLLGLAWGVGLGRHPDLGVPELVGRAPRLALVGSAMGVALGLSWAFVALLGRWEPASAAGRRVLGIGALVGLVVFLLRALDRVPPGV